MATRSRKLTGSAGALLGYFEELRLRALESYYSPISGNGKRDPDDVVFDEVWGKAAQRLGLTQLTRAQFTELAEGRWDGEQLVGSGYRKVVDKETGEERTERVRTTAIDVVIAAPKSVMEFLIAIEDEVLHAQVIAAFKDSVRAGFDNMEEHAAVARVPVQTPTERGHATVEHGPRAGQPSKMQGSRTKRVPAELIATPVIQFSARPTDATVDRNSPPDPHLHAHVVVMGVCWVPGDADPSVARTYTPDEQGIRATAAEREAVWMGEFARRLEALGIRLDYSIDRKGTITWEIHGSNANIRRFFSTNGEHAHALKRKFEQEHGRSPTETELTKLRDMTRRRKDADAKQVDQYGARERWRADLKKAGLKLKAPKLVRDGVRRESHATREEELHDRLLWSVRGTGLTRDDAVFTRDEMRAAIARCAVGLGFTREDFARTQHELEEHDLVLVRGARDPRFDLFTTRQVIEQELAIAQEIERKAHQKLPAPRRDAIKKAIEKSRVPLDDEQRAAVELMCSSQAWVMLEGHAGTGKTSTLHAVVDAYRDTPLIGRPAADDVIVLSTAAATAERTGQPLEADHTWSIDAFVMAVRMGAYTPTSRTLIIVDEAAMVDTPREAALLRHAAGDARIINVGDPAQLVPVGPAGWYADAAARHGVHELERVYRQKDQADVRDYKLVREGAAAQALASLNERGRVHIVEDRSHAVQLAVEMYREHRDAGRSEEEVVIVLEGSNHEVDTVNRLVQREREQSEEIAGPGLEVRATETNRRWTLHEDDLVIFLEKYDRHPWDTELPAGEKRQRRVDNGETGAIVDIDYVRNLAVVSMDRGDVITVNLEEEARRQPLGLAYGIHVAKYQGGEAPIAIVLPSTSPIASQNSGYTQLTRAEIEAHLVLDNETHGARPVEKLAHAWSQSATKRTAVSQLDPEVVAHVLAKADAEREEAAARRWWTAMWERMRREDPVATRAHEPDAHPAAEPGDASAAPGQPIPTDASPQQPPPPRREPKEQERTDVEADELLVAGVDLERAPGAAGESAPDRADEPERPARAQIETHPPLTARQRKDTEIAETLSLLYGRDVSQQKQTAEPTLDPNKVGKGPTAQEKYDAEVTATFGLLYGEAPPRRTPPAAQPSPQEAREATIDAEAKRLLDNEVRLRAQQARGLQP